MDSTERIELSLPPRILAALRAQIFQGTRTIIDLGCGRRKFPGAIGVDAHSDSNADVRHDLNCLPYPFGDASADIVIMRHVIEHLDDIVATFREVARILKPGGRVLVLTPHFSDASSWIDPTHRWHLATRSVEAAAKGLLGLRMTYVKMRKPWRLLGVERFINNAPFQGRVPKRVVSWENDWCYVIRGGEMSFVLEKPV